MNCCQWPGIEDLFGDAMVAKELEPYREKGPAKTTRRLVEAFKKETTI